MEEIHKKPSRLENALNSCKENFHESFQMMNDGSSTSLFRVYAIYEIIIGTPRIFLYEIFKRGKRK